MRGRQLFVALATVLVLGLVWWAQGGGDSPGPGSRPGSGTDDTHVVQVDDLPAEARNVLGRIDSGGPFKYPENDGVTFENREGLLPDHPRGYYEEFTVETSRGQRGPQRIVTGDEPDEVYWTRDHYQSFARVEGADIEVPQ